MNAITRLVGRIDDGHTNGQIRSANVSGTINVGGGSQKEIETNTVEWWNSHPEIISRQNTIYVYSNYKQIDDKYIPGIKVGDGSAYLIDIPFIDILYSEHIDDSDIHVTLEEKEFWNSKVRCEYSGNGLLDITIY